MSRESILVGVRAQHSESAPLPAIPEFGRGARDGLMARFREVLEQVGGMWAECGPDRSLAEIIHTHYPDAERIVSCVDEPPASTLSLAVDASPADLIRVELAILSGRLGVAENAAVWIDGEQLPHRALPFVAEHCVLRLGADSLVADMHAAYAALAGRKWDYGVFVSGPSKTADIEQSLVIGAQGPRTLLVVFDGQA